MTTHHLLPDKICLTSILNDNYFSTIDNSGDDDDDDDDDDDNNFSLLNNNPLLLDANQKTIFATSIQFKTEAKEEVKVDELENEMFAYYKQRLATIHQKMTTYSTIAQMDNPDNNPTVMIPPPVQPCLSPKTSTLLVAAIAATPATAPAIAATAVAPNDTTTQNITSTLPFIPLQDDQPKVANASLQGIDMIVFQGETRTGEHQLELLKTVAGLPNSFHIFHRSWCPVWPLFRSMTRRNLELDG